MKKFLKYLLFRLVTFFQRIGFDILPRHFYSQIPDISRLKRDRTWRKAMSLVGIKGANIDEQRERFRFWMEKSSPISGELQSSVYVTACKENGAAGYGPVEAEVWFRFVNAVRAKTILQIGAGVSTSIALQAPLKTNIIAIDPFPTDYLKVLAQQGKITLRAEPAQESPLAIFESLEAGDILFIDSTHTVSPGSEVNYLILEVLPRLKSGVLVHFHDIYFPYDYQRHLLDGELFFQSESTLLQAFLTGNSTFRVEFALSMLHYQAPELIKQWVPRYQAGGNQDGLATAPDGHFPSAIYLTVL